MMCTKDKYSIAFITLFIAIIILIIFVINKSMKGSFVSLISGLIPLGFIIFFGKSRLHLTKEQMQNEDIQYKTKNCPGFSEDYSKNLDSVRLNNRIYKLVDGADIYLDNKNEFKPAGFGSAIMQRIFSGGYYTDKVL